MKRCRMRLALILTLLWVPTLSAQNELAGELLMIEDTIIDLESRSDGLIGEDAEINRHQIRTEAVQLAKALTAAAEDADLALEESQAALEIAVWFEGWLRAAYGALTGRLAEARGAREQAEHIPTTDDRIQVLEERSLSLLEMVAGARANVVALGGEADKIWLDQVLRERSAVDLARMDLRQSKVATLTDRLDGAKQGSETDLAELLAIEEDRLDDSAVVLSRVIALMEAEELEVTALREKRLAIQGDLQLEDVSVGVLLGLLEDWGETAKATLIEEGPGWVFAIALFLGILFIFKIMAAIARKIVRKAVSSTHLDFSDLLKKFFIGMTGKIVMGIGLMIALSQLGFELGPLLAGLGIAGFVLGFALQDTLSNFASGMMILMYRPFDVGDVVSVATVTGKVHEMNLVSTTVLTFDNQCLVVPNSKIWGDVITNVTARSTRRVDLVFGIGYADEIPKAERILKDIVSENERVLSDPEPVIKLATLNDSSVDFVVRPWVKTTEYWDLYWEITREVKMRFDQEGVSIPFPQRDLHVYHETAPELGEHSIVPAKAGGSGEVYDTTVLEEEGETAESAS